MTIVLLFGHAASIAHHGRPRDTRRLVVGAAAMLCWGFSDSQIQAFVYWLIRVTYGSGPEQARAVGFFKVGERGGGRGVARSWLRRTRARGSLPPRVQMTQSAGWCIGFAFSPPHRMAPIVHVKLSDACKTVKPRGMIAALQPRSRLHSKLHCQLR